MPGRSSALTDWMAATGELRGQLRLARDAERAAVRGGHGDAGDREQRDHAAGGHQAAAAGPDERPGRWRSARPDGRRARCTTPRTCRPIVPVQDIQPANRGFAVSREYRLADCGNAAAAPASQDGVPHDRLREGGRRHPGQGDAGRAAHLVLRDGRRPAAGGHRGASTPACSTTSQAVEGPQVDKARDSPEREDLRGGGRRPTSTCATRRR